MNFFHTYFTREIKIEWFFRSRSLFVPMLAIDFTEMERRDNTHRRNVSNLPQLARTSKKLLKTVELHSIGQQLETLWNQNNEDLRNSLINVNAPT